MNIFSKTVQLRRVVVTGMGALTPIGNNLEEYWEGLKSGKSGANKITHFDATNFKTQFACEVKGFDPLNHFDRKEARKMDLFTQYAMVSSEEALKNAQVDLDKINKDEVGVIWSSGIGGLKTLQGEIIEFAKRDFQPKFNPFLVPKMIADIAAGMISIKYGFRGVNYCPVSACASSTNAVIDALNFIRLGQANMIIAGGSEASIHETAIGGFGAMKALSSRNDDPTAASRPFDSNRDGFVLGEGAAALVLEDLEHALARNAPIYAEVIGGGTAADAYHITATHPEGLGAQLAINRAMKDAGITLGDVDYINAHATSTPVGDVGEMKAIAELFKDHLDTVDVSATKSMTGHLLGAAGAIEAVASILSIKNSLIPPTINLSDRDERIEPKLRLTPNTAKAKEINIAMSNTFGFGGHNAIGVFKKFEQ
ncbi:beta-ketoacyl-[acyl-carrier-protein] synthase II [marine bacterium AO1-C]|nr:beta-ketoacyl-[acyl-carrier-protein] synthase II [marine bacterium AO1-C]